MTDSHTHVLDASADAAADARGQEGLVPMLGRQMYRIPEFDRMPPFLINVVSDTDLWAYISSRGGLTAGRIEAANCLFPYETDDKLHDCHSFTGPQTRMRVTRQGQDAVAWRPFDAARTTGAADVSIERHLYKAVEGTQLVFEEIRRDLKLRFRYRWAASDRFGMVRTVWIDNLDPTQPVSIDLVDGLVNLVPAGVPMLTLQRASCLVNAYTQAEVDEATGLGIFALTSKISDTADPGESLHANLVWSCGLGADGSEAGSESGSDSGRAEIVLDSDALDDFSAGSPVAGASMLRNRRPAYLIATSLELAPNAGQKWHVVADAFRSQPQVAAVRAHLREHRADPSALDASIEAGVAATTDGLAANVASADGLQHTADSIATAHHFANVMFNNMRGGVVSGAYEVDVKDLLAFAAVRHRAAAERLRQVLGLAADAARTTTATIDYHVLLETAKGSDDADVIRLCHEYLPITFSRRHGDPSRPWNQFKICVQTPTGERVLDYQGNWRDIFQNWEGLALSFPSYVDGMIAKFVNASTVDGFNPYRISREGIDWEAPEPDDPWSNIGYWGDHQLIYLLKLMELSHRHQPGNLAGMLRQRTFATANVPYRLKSFSDTVAHPRDTVTYDHQLARVIADRVDQMGSDGRLLLAPQSEDRVHHVTLMEKLLISVLAKVSNLVVGGGIWMNTQRPEWNDANNALAGYGLSVVTTGYLHRYARFVRSLLNACGDEPFRLSDPVVVWMETVSGVLAANHDQLAAGPVSDVDRMNILRELGSAFEAYRQTVYTRGLAETTPVGVDRVAALFDHAVEYSRHTLVSNRREDGLFHSYNLVSFDRDQDAREARVHSLAPMLEGQVSILSSGLLEPEEAATVLEALSDSALYRKDINTFMLYPYVDLPGFLDRNRVPDERVNGNPLLVALLDAGDPSVIQRDAEGVCRFSSEFHNAADLGAALSHLEQHKAFSTLAVKHRRATLDAYEAVFHHHAFTGRSGTMYGYEGLGCVYWHMVSKLLLAAQECVLSAKAQGAAPQTVDRLRQRYESIRSGLGYAKKAEDYGAFPTDPYSHTPFDRGAQQPGMTGQVKEEILTRAGELGLTIQEGQIHFDPVLLDGREFFEQSSVFNYLDVHQTPRRLELEPGSLALTWCQVPVVVRMGGQSEAQITVHSADGTSRTVAGLALDAATSRMIFRRTGEIQRLEVSLPSLD